jgi:hypothetical protein
MEYRSMTPLKLCSLLVLLSFGIPASAQDAKKIDQTWIDKVAVLKADEQAKAVEGKLRELNPHFDGKVAFRAEGTRLVEFAFSGNGVEDIAPLAALQSVQRLHFSGTPPMSAADKDRVKDLAPLKGLPLAELKMAWSAVKDLTPLKGMPLQVLEFAGAGIGTARRDEAAGAQLRSHRDQIA